MKFPASTSLIASALVLSSSLACAADLFGQPAPLLAANPPSYYIHVGPGGLILDESAKIAAGGVSVASGNIAVPSQASLLLETGYFVTPNIGVSFTGGIPPLAQFYGTGSLGMLGKLGSAVYGPTALTAHYHFTGLGAFQPYVGGGAVYMVVFKTNDGALTQAHLQNAWGATLQVGADYMINEHWGAFFDVKKAYLRSKATGFLGATPVVAKVKLDPLVLHMGLAYRF